MGFVEFHKIISRTKIKHWRDVLPENLGEMNHGDLDNWLPVLNQLPDVHTKNINLNTDFIQIGSEPELKTIQKPELITHLKKLHPWRKGPYNFFSIKINTEWRSDMKWNRLINHIKPLQGRKILDVGCGNGYHCLRMAGAGGKLVIGIDPYILFVIQFMVFKKYLKDYPVFVLPVGIETLPKNRPYFDTVFSMGVFYHRKSPFEHLMDLRALLNDGGQLVIETLVVEGGENTVLVPPDRYGKMRNVWFLPSPDTMLQWLQRAGFKNPRLIDVTQTTTAEQHKTDWMTFESLSDYLNPDDSGKTIENLPAPTRAIFTAEK
jgi:tRNA (mo5U34)-methyltransferase